jgi:hypothetical protein
VNVTAAFGDIPGTDLGGRRSRTGRCRKIPAPLLFLKASCLLHRRHSADRLILLVFALGFLHGGAQPSEFLGKP